MKYEALLATMISKHEMLFSADNALESKAISMGGFNVAILLGYTALVLESALRLNTFGALGILLLILSVILLFTMIFPRSYETASVSIKEHPEYLNITDEELSLKVISNIENAFRINSQILKDKNFIFKVSVALTFLGYCCVLTSFIFKYCV